MRCFICIEIKTPEIITKILEFQEELKSLDGKIKFVEPENIHFTFKFLGEIENSVVTEIFDVMKKISISAFVITIKGAGSFPRVIWIDISEGRDELSSIYTFLNQNLKSLGFKPENKRFSPHITIGRIKFIKDRKSLTALLQKWQDYFFGKIEVRSIQLKKSILTPKGPIYTTLEQIQL